MKLEDVTKIISGLDKAGVKVWVDGGWCVDALVGYQLREHNDLDIAVSRPDENALRDWFLVQGYTDRPSSDKNSWNYVVGNDKECLIDVHIFEFDDGGNHVYGVEYPYESLTGHATLVDLAIHCIPPEWMFRFKTGYAPSSKDLIDVYALAEKYGFEIPVTHRASVDFRLAEIADIESIVQIDDLNRREQISNAVRNGECFIAERAASIIGFAIQDYSFFECGFIKLLIVSDKQRRQGIGGSMVKRLLCQCKTEKLFTSTNKSNAPMRGLLLKHGFIPCGQVDALEEGDPELFFVRKKN